MILVLSDESRSRKKGVAIMKPSTIRSGIYLHGFMIVFCVSSHRVDPEEAVGAGTRCHRRPGRETFQRNDDTHSGTYRQGILEFQVVYGTSHRTPLQLIHVA